MIAVIDYEMGNLHSVIKGFEKVGGEVKIVTTPQEIADADKVVLPGVGAFRDAIAALQTKGLVEPIQQAIQSGKWFLGICLGLQLLFEVSYEEGEYEGLGVIPGDVRKFDFSGHPQEKTLKIPHMGWNSLTIKPGVPLYREIPDEAFVYFVHSYYVAPRDPEVAATITHHGIDFVSSISKDNVMATQFHPEKSQNLGLQILKNFVEL